MAAKIPIVKAAFELQSSRLFEQRSKVRRRFVSVVLAYVSCRHKTERSREKKRLTLRTSVFLHYFC